MSTELGEIQTINMPSITVTQYAGSTERGRCIQLTQHKWSTRTSMGKNYKVPYDTIHLDRQACIELISLLQREYLGINTQDEASGD